MRQRRPTPYYRIPSEAPIRDLNTTPLIDVMLVLLVLFIITMPMANHKVAVDLPQAGPAAGVEPVVQRLDIDAAGRLSWIGAASFTSTPMPRRATTISTNCWRL